jgi:ABC-type Na+ efflux pump permease subunit
LLALGIPPIPLWAAVALFLCFVMGFIFYASLFAAVGAMVNSQEDVQQAATPVMLLLESSVIFMGPLMANPGSAMARTMSMLPTSAPIIMPLRITLVPVPWMEVVGALSGVAAACAASIWLSGRVYRVGLLMYGKKPSVRELVRWIKYARCAALRAAQRRVSGLVGSWVRVMRPREAIASRGRISPTHEPTNPLTQSALGAEPSPSPELP